MNKPKISRWALVWTCWRTTKYEGGRKCDYNWRQLQQLTRPVKGKQNGD